VSLKTAYRSFFAHVIKRKMDPNSLFEDISWDNLTIDGDELKAA